jgi:hypothetical protein
MRYWRHFRDSLGETSVMITYVMIMDLLVLDTAIPYKRMSTLKKHITDFGTFPHFILTCIKICFSLLLQYVCRFDVSQMSILKFEINSKV